MHADVFTFPSKTLVIHPDVWKGILWTDEKNYVSMNNITKSIYWFIYKHSIK